MASIYPFTKEELDKVHPDSLLCRMLSTKATLPISENSTQPALNGTQIGKGQCGEVHINDTTKVKKTPNLPEKIVELRRDYHCHTAVVEAWRDAPSSLGHNISTPETREIEYDSVYNYDLFSERILPLQAPIPEMLLRSVYPKSTKIQRAACLNMPENNNCLVRLYLGRRGVDRSKSSVENMTLRNFPLHVDEMERLNLPVPMYVEAIAEALALMHWSANIDANDVEFILGSSRQDLSSSQDQGHSASIWLLDFNQCRKFNEDKAGLKLLVDGFWMNDPYYPRPSSTDKRDKVLWTLFSSKYLDASALLMDGKMPRQFIEGVEEEGYRWRERPSIFAN
ncbi:hypothetical protein AUEXF2481DRAFT_32880 [Aureobasidium subglaciale EXF-2481]|uniref:DUF3669 domain-containing protein n=1 Tax=Aureobasidium subglaciale (strain EXF-2481) TaxID=1043005 RepID=A0A074Y1X5_AURSE|nr:uncharacterized protein AUEXF2481DRAFT_32880 [Aureobasidium subglaciale EXF-2481]KEQ91710.1 hypothetical protein AUEXF2481DRAFT_32880 [Aureobasidium subglaciale EXF-2481]